MSSIRPAAMKGEGAHEVLYNIICFCGKTPRLTELKKEWEKYGGCLTHVLSAKEAVKAIAGKDRDFHLIGIVSDYAKEQLLPSIKLIRDASDIPIIVISGIYNKVDMIASLRSGADSYIQLPETMEELVMIGMALLKRYCIFECARHNMDAISYREMRLDIRFRQVFIRDTEIHLTRGEFECLHMLMSSPGRTYEYDKLYYGTFGERAQAELIINSIRTLIARIRQKLGPEYSKCIQSVHGIGYKSLAN